MRNAIHVAVQFKRKGIEKKHRRNVKMNGEEPAVEHKESIAEDNLVKLDEYFKDVLDSRDPVKLTYFCWYNLSLHFALQGAEVQTKLKKSDNVFDMDSQGREIFTIRRDFLSKNCPRRTDGCEFKSCGRLQEP